MAVVDTRSRRWTTESDPGITVYDFPVPCLETSLIRVYVNNVELDKVAEEPGPGEFTWSFEGEEVTLGEAPPAGSCIEITRTTLYPEDPVEPSPTELLFMVQELLDEMAIVNGHGPAIKPNGSGPSLLRNIVIGSEDETFPVVQLLPDGRLVAEPDGINPGGFRQAALRFEHRIPASVPPQSMAAGGWFSLILDDPEDQDADSNKSYYGFRFLFKGYQNAQGENGEHHLENVAINPVADTAAGATKGNAQAIVVEARHEPAQATLTWGSGDSALTLTAEGGEPTRGAKGNDWSIEILNASPRAALADLEEKEITIKTGTGEENTAQQVADMINGLITGVESQAKDLIVAVAGGDGDGAVSATSGFVPLEGGLDTDGKLVAVQAVVVPRGFDPGPGYADEDGGIVIPGNAFESYAYAANSNGYYPAFAAVIAKGKPEPGEPFFEGWYNAFVAHVKTKSRLLWMAKYFAIEVPGFNLNEGPNPRSHDSMWMGLGTDEPEGTLHIRTAAIGTEPGPETPEIILDNANAYDATENADVARITMKGIGTGDPLEMVALAGTITDPSSTAEDAKLRLSVAEGGTLTARWNLAAGIWAEGVGGGNKGAGSINAADYYVGGTKALYAEAATPSAIKMRLGNPQGDTISGGAADYIASSMTIDTEGGASSDDLDTINGGTVGDILILRTAHNSRDVVVKNGTGNIHCGTDRTLSNKLSTITLMCTTNDGWVCLAYQAN